MKEEYKINLLNLKCSHNVFRYCIPTVDAVLYDTRISCGIREYSRTWILFGSQSTSRFALKCRLESLMGLPFCGVSSVMSRWASTTQCFTKTARTHDSPYTKDPKISLNLLVINVSLGLRSRGNATASLYCLCNCPAHRELRTWETTKNRKKSCGPRLRYSLCCSSQQLVAISAVSS